MLHGRAMNVMPQYSKEAEDLLSRAVKLDPKLAEAWVYLGECYWKNNQIESAKNCFVGSLSHVSFHIS
jgi:Tfp pilus assembly protein PilF